MKRLYVSSDGMLIGHLKTVLEQHHVRCMVKNAYLTGGIGELPPTECWPELWVEDDADLPLARRLLDDVLQPESTAQPWRCRRCGECIEPQFAQCWNCGAPSP